MDALMKYIARIYRCSVLYHNEMLAPEGLNGYQRTYILRLCERPGLSQEQLAKMIYVNKSTVARQVALLEQNGFVSRVPSETDRRVMLVYPTEKARAVYPKVLETSREWNRRLTEELDDAERDKLEPVLAKLMERAELEAAGVQKGGREQ